MKRDKGRAAKKETKDSKTNMKRDREKIISPLIPPCSPPSYNATGINVSNSD